MPPTGPSRSSARALHALVVVVAMLLLAAGSAHAGPSLASPAAAGAEQSACDDDSSSTMPTTTRLLLPCAMADSGVLAPDCLDAIPFVVTIAGTPLCEVEVAAFASSSSSPHLERAPPGEAGHVPASAVFALLPAAALLPPVVVATDVVRCRPAPAGIPRDAHRWRPPRPS